MSERIFGSRLRRFPDYYEGKWFVVDYVRKWIMVATMNEDCTKVVSMERFLSDEKYTSPLNMDSGPSGDLYTGTLQKFPSLHQAHSS